MVERVSVRMYEVGFGDCLLVTFRSGDSAKRVLFDCGSLSRRKADVARVAADVIATCTDGRGKARLELVVCTHRHKDHVSGFDDAAWSTVEVGEVWMPWTEDPDDPRATRIRNRQSSFAAALYEALAPGLGRDATPLAEARAARKQATIALALNALTNEKAMGTLHSGFAGKPPRRFLPAADAAFQTLELAGLPGVRFHVLGPSRDEDVIKDMDPPAGKAYLTRVAARRTDEERDGAFSPRWRVTDDAFRAGRPDTTFGADDRKDVDDLADQPDGDMAAVLDSAVNNTSLMMMIEVGNQFLLFPGDAQWGTWDAILRRPEGRALLARTTALKVSHHGSHNGTPRSFVDEVIGGGVVALLSTGTVKMWPGIPRRPLVEALGARTVLVRSDEDQSAEGKTGFTVRAGFHIEWETAVG
ncbi:hypothetical protein ASF41_22495 [Methylobacterium sp. Leaf111]|uniref:hypothetical protein n=1 Tax=Methylobacterium sp. Leaf111 TaxID=1736257 RepID=UPI0006FC6A3E|nr:hypothetical protein [Methylobacterium sp. Leaf111]KQP62779.1 hypothetical protein ASF41_22495 [Methylobacterium sp. Leaf111]